MKNILWLVSWYPNRFDRTHADFIQRQAKAVALYANIHVLYIHPVESGMKTAIEEVITKEENLTEQVIYYNSSKGLFRKLNSLNRYYKLAKNQVQKYIDINGLPDYVHVQVPLRAGAVALWMKKKFKMDYALTEHYGIYNQVAEDNFDKRSFFYRDSTKKIIKQAHPFICVSRQLGNEVNRVATKKDFVVIPNVVDTALFNFQEKKEKNARFRFLHVSNMIPLKNVEGIINAAKLLSAKRNDFELRIVGLCPSPVFQYAEQSGLLNTHIFFTGEVPYTQVATEMQQADAFILFSHSESASCVIEEALCCGLPVISTPVGIAPEYINEYNGRFVNVDDAIALCEQMNWMINNESQFKRTEIASGVKNIFSYEEVGKKIVSCYSA